MTGIYKQLCTELMKAFAHKFSYELHSSVYHVAALLHTKQLVTWYHRPDCLEERRSAIDALPDVLKTFVLDKAVDDQESGSAESQPRDQPLTLCDDDLSMYMFDNYTSQAIANPRESISTKVRTELSCFVQYIEDKKCNDIVTQDFWTANRSVFPNICNLAFTLLCIPASSAFIERHYSITAICDQHNGNMSDETIINRAMFKANMKELNERS